MTAYVYQPITRGLINRSELARRVGVSQTAICQWIEAGKIMKPTVNQGFGYWREAEYDQLLEQMAKFGRCATGSK